MKSVRRLTPQKHKLAVARLLFPHDIFAGDARVPRPSASLRTPAAQLQGKKGKKKADQNASMSHLAHKSATECYSAEYEIREPTWISDRPGFLGVVALKLAFRIFPFVFSVT